MNHQSEAMGLLYRARMIAYHEDTQDFAMFCFALGQTSISRWDPNLRQQVSLTAAA